LSKGSESKSPWAGLGKVAGAHGIQGLIKVRADASAATTDPEVFAALGEVVIGDRPYKVLKAGRLKSQVLLHLEGVQTRSQAESLVGREVLGDRRQFPALPPGEYYYFQLLGLPVLNDEDGALLGHLHEIIPTPGHDVYVVRRNRNELLLPAVEEVILKINLEEGFIRVRPPAGLLETYAD
jgi:16S rRNA processing protein RimM